MKIITCLIIMLGFISSVCFSEDIFDGKWVIRALFEKEYMIFEHWDGETAIVINSNRTDQNVIINQLNQTVKIPAFFEVCEEFRYFINHDGTIDLFLLPENNSVFASMIIGELEKAKSINKLTDDLIEKLKIGIIDVFMHYPVYRFYRVN